MNMPKNGHNPHLRATGVEKSRRWLGLGGKIIVAERVDRVWRLTTGPTRLIGRAFAHIRDLRLACCQADWTQGYTEEQHAAALERLAKDIENQS